MKRRLPPLKAIVAFEAAARNESFKKAGDELCVSSSAISHQIRFLEGWLGIKLFERSTRVIELTDFGRRYKLELSPLLDQLEKFSNNKIECRKNRKVITIQTTDSFASRWLIPRLSEFDSLNPDIIIKIVTHDFRESLRSSEADLGILFIPGKTQHCAGQSNQNMQLLFSEEIFPVCAPAIMRNKKLLNVADLPNFTLIYDNNVGVSWQEWISSATKEHSDTLNREAKYGPCYNHAHLALKAAELGNGLTLASNILAGDALEKGILIAPFAEKIITGHGYYLVQPQQPEVVNRCRPFTEWIFSKSDESN